jgi:hypothetical protein
MPRSVSTRIAQARGNAADRQLNRPRNPLFVFGASVAPKPSQKLNLQKAQRIHVRIPSRY